MALVHCRWSVGYYDQGYVSCQRFPDNIFVTDAYCQEILFSPHVPVAISIHHNDPVQDVKRSHQALHEDGRLLMTAIDQTRAIVKRRLSYTGNLLTSAEQTVSVTLI